MPLMMPIYVSLGLIRNVSAVIYDKEKAFAGRMMGLDSARMKNDGCRIPPRLSVYNHMVRKRITSSNSSDGLSEIYVHAEAARYADA